MKRFLLALIPVCLALLHGTSQVTAQGSDCEPMSVPPTCTGNATLTINNQSKTVSPPNLCAQPGQEIFVNATPDGEASIEGKGGGWPSGSGSSFTIVAPTTQGEYDYDVYFSDGSCKDPRISVGR